MYFFSSAHSFSNEHKTCSGLNTYSSQCGSKYKSAAPECCPGLVCHQKKCTRKPKHSCAVENERARSCGASGGKDACCDDLVCHTYQSWRCVNGKIIDIIYSFNYL